MLNIKIGKKGEILAKEFLEKKGYTILETNKHFSKNCEIDIIAKDKETVVFVEVKTRSNDFCGSPLEAITKTKFNNIKTGAFLFLKDNNFKNFRIDAIGIVLKPEIKITHIKNVSII